MKSAELSGSKQVSNTLAIFEPRISAGSFPPVLPSSRKVSFCFVPLLASSVHFQFFASAVTPSSGKPWSSTVSRSIEPVPVPVAAGVPNVISRELSVTAFASM